MKNRWNAYIKSTLNNTLITITDENNKPQYFKSGGVRNSRGVQLFGRKRASSYAASLLAKSLGIACKKKGISVLDLYVNGYWHNVNTIIESFRKVGVVVRSLNDKTPVPYNGCRGPKKRRI